jgi:hypothetical protein
MAEKEVSNHIEWTSNLDLKYDNQNQQGKAETNERNPHTTSRTS